MKFQESETTELKRSLNKDFAKEVVAFLNTRDGLIYIGVSDDGAVVGVESVESTMRQVRDIIRDQILPFTDGLCEIGSLLEGDRPVVFVKIRKGTKLYYVKKEGRSSSGCFFRDGTSSVPMREEEIERRLRASLSGDDLLKEARASYAPLSFRQLKSFYLEAGYTLGEETFAENLGLLTGDGGYNKLAELLADKNRVGFIYAAFNGKDKSSMRETVDFGNQCLLLSVDKLMARLEAENRGITSFSTTVRHTRALFDLECAKEAVYNALAHNDYLSGGVPSVYLYEDRVEVLSYGGLPFGQTKENFFRGVSKPRSESLTRILRDLGYAERTGHGVPSIIAQYGREAFEIEDSFVLVTIPFDKEVLSGLRSSGEAQGSHVRASRGDKGKGGARRPKGRGKGSRSAREGRREEAVALLQENPSITLAEAAARLGVSLATARRLFSSLKKEGMILKSRGSRHGSWVVRERIPEERDP